MKLIRFAAPLTISLLLAACGGQERQLRYGPAELDHSRLSPTRVTGKILAAGEYLGQPREMIQLGSQLLVLDNASDSVLHLISLTDGRHLASQGRRGAGPSEYKGAWGLLQAPGDDESAWVYDYPLSRLTRVRAGGDGLLSVDPKMLTLTGDVVPLQPLWLGDSLLVSPNFSSGGRLAFFGRDGKLLRSAGPLPTDSRRTPASVLQQAWSGQITAQPSGDLLVFATLYADQLELYRRDGTLVKKVRGPFRFDPRFEVANAGGMLTMSSDESMRIGYPDVAATDRAIYALFSGRTREAFGGSQVTFGRFVHVYSWAGDLTGILELDTPVAAITVSEDGHTLYGTAENPEPVIMSFPLEG